MKRTTRLLAIGLLAIAFFCTPLRGIAGEEVEIYELPEMLKDIQQMDTTDGMRLAMWFHNSFWASSVLNDGGTQEDAQKIINLMKDYIVIIAVDAKDGGFNSLEVTPQKEVREKSVLITESGEEIAPLTAKEIDPDLMGVLTMMQPMFQQVLGKLGSGMTILVFPAKDSKGNELANEKKKGLVKLRVIEQIHEWRTPLDSVMPKKVCTGCEEDGKGSWNYCPYCGKNYTHNE